MDKVIGLIHTRFSPTGGVENYINKLVPSLLQRDCPIIQLGSTYGYDGTRIFAGS